MDFRQVLPGTLASKANIDRSKSSGGKDPESLRRACQDFESIFLTYLLKTMRKTVPKTEFSLSGLSGDTYLSMMDEEIARAVSKGPGIGLASAIYRQINLNKKS